MTTGSLSNLTYALDNLEGTDIKMPVLFIGHGSPMNAIQDNDFTRALSKMGQSLERPKAILCISAHWMTKGTWVNVSKQPKMIYDMGGFPKALYQVNYPALGSPEFAKLTQLTAEEGTIKEDTDWGFDHGNWSVMKWLFPEANIPVFQMSIDYTKPAQYHYDLARQLVELRKKGVMIVGSGNITHNLRMFERDLNASPVDWAQEFDEITKKAINNKNHQKLINYQHLGKVARLAVPEPSHWLPLLYSLGLQMNGDTVNHFYEGMHHGTFSMRCLRIG